MKLKQMQELINQCDGYGVIVTDDELLKKRLTELKPVYSKADMKSFVVLGSNNYWYGFLRAQSMEEAKKEIKEIKERIEDGEFTDSKPDELYLYEVSDPLVFQRVS